MKLAQARKAEGFETGDGAFVVPGKKAKKPAAPGAAVAKDLAQAEKVLARPGHPPKAGGGAKAGYPPKAGGPRVGVGRVGAVGRSARPATKSAFAFPKPPAAAPVARRSKESAFAFPRPPAQPVARGHGRFMPLRVSGEGRVPLDARPKRAAPEIQIAPKRERAPGAPREAPARQAREEQESGMRQRSGRR